MKSPLTLIALVAAALCTWNGCSQKKPDAKTQTVELEKAFPGLPAAGTPEAAGNDPKALVSAALVAAKGGDYAMGVILLKRAVQMPGFTPQQIMALQATKSAWVADLSTRAEKGEESAKAALKDIRNAQ
jgi:hypothetical protein